ncbi:MAG: DUF4214 domain-containing protein [Acidimicrobiales bacterium]
MSLSIVALILGAAALAHVGGDDGGAADGESVADGVRRHELALVDELPTPDGDNGPGRRLSVRPDDQFVILAVPVGDTYAVRAERAGEWSEPILLTADEAEGPDGPAGPAHTGAAETDAAGGGEGPQLTTLATSPYLLDGATTVEVVSLDGDTTPITATVLSDGFGSRPPDHQVPAVAGRQLVRGVTMPAIRSRSAWTNEGWASGNQGCGSAPSHADNIQAMVVHHTVTTNNYAEDRVDDLLRAVWYAHVGVNGWCDIGYNFLVDRFGTIWEGRTGGIERAVVGGHAKGFNTSTVGVALLGQHQPRVSPAVARPSAAAEDAVRRLATWKLGLHGVDPEGMTWLKNRSTEGPQRLASNHWHLVPTVMGHRDVGVTSCPGSHGYDLVHGLGSHLVAARNDDVPYRFDAWTPADIGAGLITVDARGGIRPSGGVGIPGVGAPLLGPGPLPPPSPRPLAVGASRRDGVGAGYVLHADGMVHAFGPAPDLAVRPAGDRPPVDLTVTTAADGGWVIDAEGAVHGFGSRTDLPVEASASGGPVIRGDLDPGSGDGYLVEADGRLRAVGAAPPRQLSTGPVEAVDVAVRPGAAGGWVLDRQGRLHPFGPAPTAGITTPSPAAPSRRLVAVAAGASGHGGWLMSSDGQLWPFGQERIIKPLSTDATRDDAVDVVAVEPALPAGFATGPTGRYLDAVVRLFLGRPATGAELVYWEGRLTYGDGRAAVTTALARSDEWAGRRIDAMYRDVLGRPADEEGRRYWVGEVGRGLSLQRVGVFFYGSEEYVAAAGSPTAYVTRLYDRLLGRSVDQEGLSYWVGQLSSGRARATDVAAGFYASPESRRGRVVELYREVLGRDPDQSGSEYWAERLLAVDDVVLAAELATSDEFHERATR